MKVCIPSFHHFLLPEVVIPHRVAHSDDFASMLISGAPNTVTFISIFDANIGEDGQLAVGLALVLIAYGRKDFAHVLLPCHLSAGTWITRD